MKIKLQNKIQDFIAVVYQPDGTAIKPLYDFYEMQDDVEYFIVCAHHSYIYKNNKITMYNYL